MRDLLGFTFRLLVLTSAKVRGSHVGALSTRRMLVLIQQAPGALGEHSKSVKA
jgi:hypothetical protein